MTFLNRGESIDTVALESTWKRALLGEFEKPYMQVLKKFLLKEKEQGKIIYPAGRDIFAAFKLCPVNKVKVVILGQDPYHGVGQAHGLCFSVKNGVKPPPSLLNIYKELEADLNIKPVRHGCLISWAQQGVLLLNSVLTVEEDKAASHQGKGWELFTDEVIKVLNKKKEKCIFLLWGGYAKQKGNIIDRNKHLVLEAAHPSPLSAHRGFFGCKHFSKVNKQLIDWGFNPIDWDLVNCS